MIPDPYSKSLDSIFEAGDLFCAVICCVRCLLEANASSRKCLFSDTHIRRCLAKLEKEGQERPHLVDKRMVGYLSRAVISLITAQIALCHIDCYILKRISRN